MADKSKITQIPEENSKERRQQTFSDCSQPRNVLRLSQQTWTKWNELKHNTNFATHDDFAVRLLQVQSPEIQAWDSNQSHTYQSAPRDEGALKDLPYYKSIVKSFLKKQIVSLMEDLARETGEETIVISADIHAGIASNICSSHIQTFVQGHLEFQEKFLAFCLNGYKTQNGKTISSPKSVKRRIQSKLTDSLKRPRHKSSLSSSRKSENRTASGTADSVETETGLASCMSPVSSMSTAAIPATAVTTTAVSDNVSMETPSLILGVYPDNEDTREVIGISGHSDLNSESSNAMDIKVEPLADETFQDFTVIKTEPHSDTEVNESHLTESTDQVNESGNLSDESVDNIALSSPGGTRTVGPIRFVRKFPPKERTTLSLIDKIQIIQDYETGDTTQRKLAIKYKISKTCVAEMLRNRQVLKKHYELNANSTRKRFNTNSKFSEINEVVWYWFKTARENGIQMSGPMVQEKALQVADELKVKDFKASNGWLHSWKNRFCVTCYRDDTDGGQKQNYINDYSKVEGLNAAGPNSKATDAIMNLGSLPSSFSILNQESTSAFLEKAYKATGPAAQ